MDIPTASADRGTQSGPPQFKFLDHVSLSCRDLDEGVRFYRDVLGGELVVQESAFALFNIAGARVGISTAGCTFMEPGDEYPHIAFNCDADALVAMKDWLTACGVPSTNFWTRSGVETLMFFRDPSGNVIELFCEEGHENPPDTPRGPAQGHGSALDIDATRYSDWHLPQD